ncbi:nucleotidyltransferase [Aureibacillus halotolerans]|uniref:tRNA(Met) cytidine acetate ligase n=1 Tax=Aureibacillus halotolerans TaxID=1508390 RepID=A0A4R6U710_9BACI|nr:nucleotidyltransferase [Aureibacillus halotolerans]TDQ42310.1 putative nucleotidyltransferase [Aureibacillus halotolerans]
MKAVGMIVEYNPFHNGHLYHLQKSKYITGADVTVAVMSGNFLQRGEPALLPKWQRAEMALRAGVDIIVELPYAFAVARADLFALGAVHILSELGVSDVCFGSESGDIGAFQGAVSRMQRDKERIDQWLKDELSSGVSYPKAAAAAFQAIAPELDLDVSQPNNSLGLHYVAAIKQLGIKALTPHTIQRKQAQYHEPSPNGSIASATAIRNTFFSEGIHSSALVETLPAPTLDIMKHYLDEFGRLHQWEDYFAFVQLCLLSQSPRQLHQLYEMEEGVEHRLQKYARASSFNAFLSAAKTKRYTWTRLQRVCTHMIHSIPKLDYKPLSQRPLQHLPEEVRLLGFTKKGQAFLQETKKSRSIHLVTQTKERRGSMLSYDERSAAIHALAHPPALRARVWDDEKKRFPIQI